MTVPAEPATPEASSTAGADAGTGQDPTGAVGAAQAASDAENAAQAEADREAAEQAEREAQLQRLLDRMQENADFPSLKDSIRGIQTVARSESAHLRALTEEVLGDPALSNKLLRMINTAFYSSVGAGNITSLARAVALMGFQPVGMLATSLTLFEKLPKGPDGTRVKQEFSRGLMAAMLANQFCPVRRLEESAYVVALFQNLGTMLAWMHFPAEATRVELLMHERGREDHDTLQAASREVLGMGYDDLAVEVTRLWGWPEGLRAQLRPLEPADPEQAVVGDDYLRVVCTAANHLAAEMEQVDDTPEALEALAMSFWQRHGVALGLAEEDVGPMLARAQTQWSELAMVLGFTQVTGAPVARGRGAETVRPTPRSLARALPRKKPLSIVLGGAVDEVSRLIEAQAPLSDLLQLVMSRLLETLELQRVLVCLRDGGPGGDLVGRLGLGERAQQLAPVFRVPMRPPADLFGLLCAKGADTLISDTDDPVIAQRLPIWYRRRVAAPTFLLLPLVGERGALGLIYGDRAVVNGLVINEAELKLLKALRDQLMVAVRAKGL